MIIVIVIIIMTRDSIIIQFKVGQRDVFNSGDLYYLGYKKMIIVHYPSVTQVITRT